MSWKNESGSSTGKKVVSPDPAPKAVCACDLFTADVQIQAKTKHLLKILQIPRANSYR